jgi:transcriptional regulator with XRE-family HTH domain
MNNKHEAAAGFASLRLYLGLTQQEFADRLGISRSLLAMTETGKRSLPASAQKLLLGLHHATAHMPVPETGFLLEKKRGRLSPNGRVHNRLNKPEWQRDIARLPELTSGGNQDRAECAALIRMQVVQKETLQQQLQYMMQEREAALAKEQELAAQLNLTGSLIEIAGKRIIGYDSPLKKKNAEIGKAKLGHKKLLLERQLMRYNPPSILEREFRINVIERYIAVVAEILEALQQRMNELS